jgi:CubicO group peptidase (beta-lactamase class C family)
VSAGPSRCPHERRTNPWTAGWSVLLLLCALLLTPSPARAEDGRDGRPDAHLDFQAIDAYVISQMQAMHIPGVALAVVSGDEVVHIRGFGVAGPDGRAMTAQTPLVLGSSSKSFTALAVMQLVEAGKIDLDAPVQRYLPWFRAGAPRGPDARPITVRHLLNHTSGLPTGGITGASITGPVDETMEQKVSALGSVALTAPVGTTFQYANSNYVTLGLVVQTVSGQSYESYVQEHIFAPLGMRRSFASEAEAARHGMATGYRWWFGLPAPSSLPAPRGTAPAGFLVSSAEDMARYLVAQLNDGRFEATAVLSPEGVAQLHRPAVSMDPHRADATAYAMGWAVGSSGEPRVSHGGDTANFHSDMTILPARRLGVVVLMNVNGNLAIASNAHGVIAQGVERLLLGEQPPPVSGFGQRYVAFDAALLLGSALAVWSLVRLLRRRSHPPRTGLAGVLVGLALPLLWELALPVGLLMGWPSLSQASWPLTLLFFPDLGYWLLGLAAVLVATGCLRLALAVPRPRAWVSAPPAPAPRRTTGAAGPVG